MATVTLTTLWLNDATDLTDYRSFPLMNQLRATPQTPGEVRLYANGRFRSIKRAGAQQQLAATLAACDRDQVDWIEAHAGRLLLVRDDRGRKFYGTYYGPTIDEHPYDDEADVTLTLVEISHSEAV